MTRTIRTLKAGLLAATAATLATGTAMAGGFEVREQSTYFQGTSWAGVAAGGHLSSMFWNPAAAGGVGAGITTNSNYALLLPNSDITATGLGAPGVLPPGFDTTVDIGEMAIVPASYAAIRLSPQTVFAVGINSQFGLGTKPDNKDWIGQSHARASKLFSMQVNPTMAYEVMPGVTLGAGIQIQYIDLKRFTQAVGVAPAGVPSASLHANDIGIGATAGITLKPTPTTTVGVGYRSAIHHDADGGLIRPATPVLGVHAKLITPEKVTASLRQDLSSNMRVMGTVEWTNWSRLGVVPVVLTGTPVVVSTLDFQWEDGWLYSIGGEYDVNDKLQLRAGVAYEKSPIQDATARLIQVPDADRIWASIGATYKWSESTKIEFAYSHVFVEDSELVRLNPVGTPLFADVDSSVDIISVGLTMKLGGEPAKPMK